MIKRISKIFFVIILIMLLFTTHIYADDENEIYENIIEESEKQEIEAAASSDTKPTINSRRYAVYDRLSGRCIYGKDENKQTAQN